MTARGKRQLRRRRAREARLYVAVTEALRIRDEAFAQLAKSTRDAFKARDAQHVDTVRKVNAAMRGAGSRSRVR